MGNVKYYVRPLGSSDLDGDRGRRNIRELEELLKIVSSSSEQLTPERIIWARACGTTIMVACERGTDQIIGLSELARTAKLSPGHATIEEVAVLPAHQSSGIARTMMIALILQALVDGIRKLDLTSNYAERPGAHKLYLGLGWTYRNGLNEGGHPFNRDLMRLELAKWNPHKYNVTAEEIARLPLDLQEAFRRISSLP